VSKEYLSLNISRETEITERKTNRGLLVIYDTFLYVLCWFALINLQPSIKNYISQIALWLYPIAGYMLFFGIRLSTRCYKQIWRYGSIHAFSREILAGVLSAALLVLLGAVLGNMYVFASIPLTMLISFAAVYVLISIVMRVLYCHLYRFASKETLFSRILKSLIQWVFRVDFSSKKPGAVLHFLPNTEKQVVSPINELQVLAAKFEISGNITGITQINKGYINRTYRVETLSDGGKKRKYVLQRINTNVFPDVDALMENYKLTTTHLHQKLELPGHHEGGAVQTIRPTKDGASYLKDASGFWRMLTYFDSVYSLDIPERPETFYHAGCAFGSFLKGMSDVDVSQIKIVIPNFHNTTSRYLDMEKAVERDPVGRVASVTREIEFVRARSDRYGLISQALDSGKIPTRICHNDTNLNNILFDNETHLPVAIIDLDTVMPSSPLYDFGDSMRIGTNTAKDDEQDLSKVSCDLNLYEQYARGYLEACGDMLTKEELELLPYASLIITAEDGIRFLADHINGDTYYHIYYPGQNLDRARTHLKLLEDMEKKLPEIKKILQKIFAELGLAGQIDLNAR